MDDQIPVCMDGSPSEFPGNVFDLPDRSLFFGIQHLVFHAFSQSFFEPFRFPPATLMLDIFRPAESIVKNIPRIHIHNLYFTHYYLLLIDTTTLLKIPVWISS
jgi:hypothetical protein